MVKILLLLLVVCGLSACATPAHLGIPEAEWQNYSAEEKQKIKSDYYDMLKNRMRSEEEKAVPDGTSLRVKVSGGQVNMPPFTALANYVPLEFSIGSANCQTIQIKEQAGDRKVAMKVCYQNKTLYLDPSRYDPTKKLGSIQLHYSPIWDRGFTYQNVSSSGYVHLTNVNVAVRKYENNEPNDSEN